MNSNNDNNIDNDNTNSNAYRTICLSHHFAARKRISGGRLITNHILTIIIIVIMIIMIELSVTHILVNLLEGIEGVPRNGGRK